MSNKQSAQVGILSSDREARIHLRNLVGVAGVGSVLVESEDYPTSIDDISLTLWRQAGPNVILVDSSGPEEIVATIATLHRALPKAWLLAISDIRDTHVVLATIRAGACEFLPKPVSLQSLREAMERLHAEKERDSRTKPFGKVYGVISAKGGLGTTTVAINLAAALADFPSTNVAVVDLGYPLGDAATLLNIQPQFNVFDAFKLSSRLDSVLLESYVTQKQGVSLLAGPTQVCTEDLPSQESFQKALRVVAETYSHAVIDIPSSFSLEHLTTLLRLCDEFLIIVTPELVSLWRAHRLLGFLKRWEAGNKVRLVLNKFDARGEITQKEIEKALEVKIYRSIPLDVNLMTNAVHAGKPVVNLSTSALTESFQGLAQDLSGFAYPDEKRSGFFSGLFRKKAVKEPVSNVFKLVDDTPAPRDFPNTP